MRQKLKFRIAVEYVRARGRQAHDMSYAEQLSDVLGPPEGQARLID